MINHRKIICLLFHIILFCCSIGSYFWYSSLYSGTSLYLSAIYASDVGSAEQQNCRYEAWRSTDAYFTPGDSGSVQISSERNTSLIFVDPDSAVGNVALNHFYVMQTICNEIITETERLGEFDYALRETGSTDFNWIGLPLDLEGVHNAADLVNHIQQNSSRGLKVIAIEHWNNVSQSFDSYLPQYPLFSSEIPIVLGYAYRITVDLDNRENGEAIWTLIGDVPPATAFDTPLRATGTTDFNWVTLPLDRPMLLSSLDVYNALQDAMQDSTSSFDVTAIESWNRTSQSYDTFIPSQPDLSHNFNTQPGHVYRISLDMNPGTIIWR